MKKNRPIWISLFSAWLLSVAFQGSTLHAFWAEKGFVPGGAFQDWSIWAQVAGLVTAGFFCTSPGRSRQVMLASMTVCLGSTLWMFLPYTQTWAAAMVIAGFFGGVVIAAWASDFKEFTPPGQRLSTAAKVLVLSNVLMIVVNGVSGRVSPILGLILAAAALAAGLGLAAARRYRGQSFEASAAGLSDIPQEQLKKSLLSLYLFVALLSVNSGLMYRIVLPAYNAITFFEELYWAMPYIVVIYVLFWLPEWFNKSYILYVALVCVGLAFVLFFTLDRSITSFLIVNTLMLGAFGVCDLFWWTILGEMLTYSTKPVQIFGVGLSANVLGIGIGLTIANYLPLGAAGDHYPLIISLAVMMVTLMVLPLLYGRLARVVGDKGFVVGLNRDLANKAAAELAGLSDPHSVLPTASPDPHSVLPAAPPSSAPPGPQALLEDYLVRSELTPRERQIAGLLQKGLTYRMISQELGISENTVKSHIKGLYSKLRVSNKSEFIRKIQDIVEKYKIIS